MPLGVAGTPPVVCETQSAIGTHEEKQGVVVPAPNNRTQTLKKIFPAEGNRGRETPGGRLKGKNF